MSVGRAARPSAATPAATAPDDTTITSWPPARSAGDLVGELGDCAGVDRTPLVGDRRRADLRDDSHGTRAPQRSGEYSKLNSPIQMTSPSRAPALASILGTPSRSSR